MSTGAFTEIPLIDLGAYFAGDRASKRRVAEEISRACERIGFFLVSGHGVDPALCEQARRESMAFFELSLEESLPSGGNRTTCQSGLRAARHRASLSDDWCGDAARPEGIDLVRAA